MQRVGWWGDEYDPLLNSSVFFADHLVKILTRRANPEEPSKWNKRLPSWLFTLAQMPDGHWVTEMGHTLPPSKLQRGRCFALPVRDTSEKQDLTTAEQPASSSAEVAVADLDDDARHDAAEASQGVHRDIGRVRHTVGGRFKEDRECEGICCGLTPTFCCCADVGVPCCGDQCTYGHCCCRTDLRRKVPWEEEEEPEPEPAMADPDMERP